MCSPAMSSKETRNSNVALSTFPLFHWSCLRPTQPASHSHLVSLLHSRCTHLIHITYNQPSTYIVQLHTPFPDCSLRDFPALSCLLLTPLLWLPPEFPDILTWLSAGLLLPGTAPGMTACLPAPSWYCCWIDCLPAWPTDHRLSLCFWTVFLSASVSVNHWTLPVFLSCLCCNWVHTLPVTLWCKF